MTDSRISVGYNLSHPPAETEAIKPLIEKLRQWATDLGFHQVSELVCLNGDAEVISHEYGERFLVPDPLIVPVIPRSVIYFVASLPDSDPMEIGLAYYPCEVEVGGQVVPVGLPYWTWTGAVRTRDLRTVSKLLHHAAEVGVETFLAFAGVTLTYRRDGAGVRCEQQWDDDLGDS